MATPKGITVTPDVRPDEASIRAPAVYSNTLRISHDQHGMTLTFFSVPSDLLELEDVRQQLKDSPPTEGDTQRTIRIDLAAVAKVWMPGDLFPDVLRIVSQQYAKWLSGRKAAMERGDPADSH